MNRVITGILLVFLVNVAGWSQEPDEIPQSLLVVTSGSGLSSGQTRLFHELLLDRLHNLFFVTLVESESISAGDVDARLEIQLTRRGSTVEIRAALYDQAGDQPLSVQQMTTDMPFSPLDEVFWRDLLNPLAAHLRPDRQEIRVEETIKKTDERRQFIHARGTAITLLAQPGTLILGLIPEPLIVGEEGRIEVEVPQKASYRIKARHWRYVPETRDVYIGTEPIEVDFAQVLPQRMALSLFADFDRTTGVGFLAYLLPNRVFTEIRFENSFIGIVPEFLHFESNDWMARNLLGSLSFGLFFDLPGEMRIAVGLGGLVRFHSRPPNTSTDPPKTYRFRLNYLFPAGWFGSLVFETGITESWKVFFEWAPQFYVVRNIPKTIFDPGGAYEQMNSDDLYELRDSDVIHGRMGNVRIGVRYYF